MGSIAKMIINDPSKFSLLTVDMKKNCIKAAIATVNIEAALTRREAIKNIKARFTLRNTFTTRQVQFTQQAQGLYSLKAIQSTVGVSEKASYMARQEQGGVHKPRQGQKLAIPTDYARGGDRGRPVAALMRVSRTMGRRRVHQKTRNTGNHESNKQLFVKRVIKAFENKLFIPMGGSGGQRNLHVITELSRTGDNIAFKSKQVYRFDRKQTKTKANAFLRPAADKVAAQVQSIFNSQMSKLGL